MLTKAGDTLGFSSGSGRLQRGPGHLNESEARGKPDNLEQRLSLAEDLIDDDNDDDAVLSACLFFREDNHRLMEWLAYHYHVARLRHVILCEQSEAMEYAEDR